MDNRFLKNAIIKGAIGGASLLGLGLGGLYLLQEKLMYFPVLPGLSRSPSGNSIGDKNPREWKLDYENIDTKTSDAVTLRGWLIKQKDHMAKPTVVFFHENAGNIGMKLQYFRYYYEVVGVNILIFAYRGYSDSDEVPKIEEQGIQKDSLVDLSIHNIK